MKLTMIGTGYVGLVTGTCFAATGNEVTCVDIDEKKINTLNNCEVPFFEPGVSDLIKRNLEEERLFFTTDINSAVNWGEVIFIAVGTPQDKDGSADLKYVMEVASSIGKAMKSYKIIVTKSTVPVGTTDKVKEIIKSETNIPFDVVNNPEFLKEGNAVNDFLMPDRIVVGIENEKVKPILTELYAPYIRTENPIIFMDIKSSEMTKYASNALLATKISFINEISRLCEKVGADVESIRKGMGADKRIGYQFLFPGLGYGGSCFPKDVRAIMQTGKQENVSMKLLNAVDEVNTEQRFTMLNKINKYFNNNLKGKKIAFWGLSFKPKTDDMREAPAIDLIEGCLKNGAAVYAFDPVAMGVAKEIFKNRITLCKKDYDVLEDADALVICTEWNLFRHPNFKKIKNLMKKPVIFDGRNLYEPDKMNKLGFNYNCVGR